MGKNPLMKMLGMISWLVTSVASISILLEQYGYGMLQFVRMNFPQFAMPLRFVIGFAGMFSLYLMLCWMFGKCAGGCCGCNCKCDKCRCADSCGMENKSQGGSSYSS